MHKKLIIVLVSISVLVVSALVPSLAQDKADPPKYEYAIVKWDGTDRLYINLPSKFELMRVKEQGVGIPRDAQDEEWCLTYAANQMAKDGWEPITLDSRRIIFRRLKR